MPGRAGSKGKGTGKGKGKGKGRGGGPPPPPPKVQPKKAETKPRLTVEEVPPQPRSRPPRRAHPACRAALPHSHFATWRPADGQELAAKKARLDSKRKERNVAGLQLCQDYGRAPRSAGQPACRAAIAAMHRQAALANAGSAVLLHPPPTPVGVPVEMERGRRWINSGWVGAGGVAAVV